MKEAGRRMRNQRAGTKVGMYGVPEGAAEVSPAWEAAVMHWALPPDSASAQNRPPGRINKSGRCCRLSGEPRTQPKKGSFVVRAAAALWLADPRCELCPI